MVALAHFFDCQEALAIVKPEMFIKWERTAFGYSGVGSRAGAGVRRCRYPLVIRCCIEKSPTLGRLKDRAAGVWAAAKVFIFARQRHHVASFCDMGGN